MATSTHESAGRVHAGSLTIDAILALFNQLGFRNTGPRRLIAERLSFRAESGTDFTVHDFWAELQTLDPHIGRATVYRTVEVLVDHGVLDRVPVASGTYRYRVCGDTHHHHMRCNQCDRVVEVNACLPAELFAAVARATDFAIEGHSLELFGRCALCRDEKLQSAASPSNG